jgi:hypothetical protein
LLRDAETRAPATVSKFQKFRGSVSGSAAAPSASDHIEKHAIADVVSAQSTAAIISKTEQGSLPKPVSIFSSTGAAHLASEDVSTFSAQPSAAHHGRTDNGRSNLSHSSRATSLDLSDLSNRAIDLGSAPAALPSLKAVTEARIAAVESRTLHLQAQLDRMLSQIDIRDREIGGIDLTLICSIVQPLT